jgi:hypothetical protein
MDRAKLVQFASRLKIISECPACAPWTDLEEGFLAGVIVGIVISVDAEELETDRSGLCETHKVLLVEITDAAQRA